MDTHGQELAETYLKMLNTHNPDLVDQFVAENYINHNAFVADGREANRQFWHAFFVALPDASASMEDLVEVIVGAATGEATVRRALALVESLGKTAVVCRDSQNSIVNRVCRPL